MKPYERFSRIRRLFDSRTTTSTNQTDRQKKTFSQQGREAAPAFRTKLPREAKPSEREMLGQQKKL